MNVTGIVAIKSVNKGQNENGASIYTGEMVFKDFATQITMPFMLTAKTDKAAGFYDSYLMQPGKSGYVSGKISASPAGQPYLNLDIMEFGSMKLDGAPQQNQQYNKPKYNNQQTNKPSIEIDPPTSTFNFNNFNQEQESQSSGSSLPNSSGNAFWGSFGK